MYLVKTSRRTAALYLAWEYGFSRANAMLRGSNPKMVSENGHWIMLSDPMLRSRKRDADLFKCRVIAIANWQSGRLGKHPTGADCYVEKH